VPRLYWLQSFVFGMHFAGVFSGGFFSKLHPSPLRARLGAGARDARGLRLPQQRALRCRRLAHPDERDALPGVRGPLPGPGAGLHPPLRATVGSGSSSRWGCCSPSFSGCCSLGGSRRTAEQEKPYADVLFCLEKRTYIRRAQRLWPRGRGRLPRRSGGIREVFIRYEEVEVALRRQGHALLLVDTGRKWGEQSVFS
jgi:hypothetical protein